MKKQDKLAGSVDGWNRPGVSRTGLWRTPGDMPLLEAQTKPISNYFCVLGIGILSARPGGVKTKSRPVAARKIRDGVDVQFSSEQRVSAESYA